MRRNYNPNLLCAVSQSGISGFNCGVFHRSGDMRSVILSSNAEHVTRGIRESIDRTFGETSLETEPESDERN